MAGREWKGGGVVKTRYVALREELLGYECDYDAFYHFLRMAREFLKKNDFENALCFVKAAKDRLSITGSLNELYGTMCYMKKTQKQEEQQV